MKQGFENCHAWHIAIYSDTQNIEEYDVGITVCGTLNGLCMKDKENVDRV